MVWDSVSYVCIYIKFYIRIRRREFIDIASTRVLIAEQRGFRTQTTQKILFVIIFSHIEKKYIYEYVTQCGSTFNVALSANSVVMLIICQNACVLCDSKHTYILRAALLISFDCYLRIQCVCAVLEYMFFGRCSVLLNTRSAFLVNTK